MSHFSITNAVLSQLSRPCPDCLGDCDTILENLNREFQRNETVSDENLCDSCEENEAVPVNGYNLCESCMASFEEEGQ